MDCLTFLAIFITVIPLQIALFLCLIWFRSKFNKYENVTADVLYELFKESNRPVDNIKRLQELHTFSGHAEHNTLKSKYQTKYIVHMIKNIDTRLGCNYMGSIVDNLLSDEWMEKNPIVSASLDIATRLCLFVSNHKK